MSLQSNQRVSSIRPHIRHLRRLCPTHALLPKLPNYPSVLSMADSPHQPQSVSSNEQIKSGNDTAWGGGTKAPGRWRPRWLTPRWCLWSEFYWSLNLWPPLAEAPLAASAPPPRGCWARETPSAQLVRASYVCEEWRRQVVWLSEGLVRMGRSWGWGGHSGPCPKQASLHTLPTVPHSVPDCFFLYSFFFTMHC